MKWSIENLNMIPKYAIDRRIPMIKRAIEPEINKLLKMGANKIPGILLGEDTKNKTKDMKIGIDASCIPTWL